MVVHRTWLLYTRARVCAALRRARAERSLREGTSRETRTRTFDIFPRVRDNDINEAGRNYDYVYDALPPV